MICSPLSHSGFCHLHQLSVLLTQAENQGHPGLSTLLWSDKICGDEQLFEVARPDSKKVLEKTLWRWLPASTALLLQGCGCSLDLTPSHLHQQKGQPSQVASVPAASGSIWALSPCVWPLATRKLCSLLLL